MVAEIEVPAPRHPRPRLHFPRRSTHCCLAGFAALPILWRRAQRNVRLRTASLWILLCCSFRYFIFWAAVWILCSDYMRPEDQPTASSCSRQARTHQGIRGGKSRREQGPARVGLQPRHRAEDARTLLINK